MQDLYAKHFCPKGQVQKRIIKNLLWRDRQFVTSNFCDWLAYLLFLVELSYRDSDWHFILKILKISNCLSSKNGPKTPRLQIQGGPGLMYAQMPRWLEGQMPRCPSAQMTRSPDAQLPRSPDAQKPRCSDA